MSNMFDSNDHIAIRSDAICKKSKAMNANNNSLYDVIDEVA